MAAGVERLFIGGLTSNTTEAEVEARLGRFGEISDIKVVKKDSVNGKLEHCFAHLNFHGGADQLKKLISTFHEARWKGNTIRIERAKGDFLDKLAKEREARSKVKPATLQKHRGDMLMENFQKAGVKDFTMKRAVPGTAISGEKNWVVGKYGRVLPVVYLRTKDKRKISKYDPSKYIHHLKHLKDDGSLPEKGISSLNWREDDERATPGRSRPTLKAQNSKRKAEYGILNVISNTRNKRDLGTDGRSVSESAEKRSKKPEKVTQHSLSEDPYVPTPSKGHAWSTVKRKRTQDSERDSADTDEICSSKNKKKRSPTLENSEVQEYSDTEDSWISKGNLDERTESEEPQIGDDDINQAVKCTKVLIKDRSRHRNNPNQEKLQREDGYSFQFFEENVSNTPFEDHENDGSSASSGSESDDSSKEGIKATRPLKHGAGSGVIKGTARKDSQRTVNEVRNAGAEHPKGKSTKNKQDETSRRVSFNKIVSVHQQGEGGTDMETMKSENSDNGSIPNIDDILDMDHKQYQSSSQDDVIASIVQEMKMKKSTSGDENVIDGSKTTPGVDRTSSKDDGSFPIERHLKQGNASTGTSDKMYSSEELSKEMFVGNLLCEGDVYLKGEGIRSETRERVQSSVDLKQKVTENGSKKARRRTGSNGSSIRNDESGMSLKLNLISLTDTRNSRTEGALSDSAAESEASEILDKESSRNDVDVDRRQERNLYGNLEKEKDNEQCNNSSDSSTEESDDTASVKHGSEKIQTHSKDNQHSQTDWKLSSTFHKELEDRIDRKKKPQHGEQVSENTGSVEIKKRAAQNNDGTRGRDIHQNKYSGNTNFEILVLDRNFLKLHGDLGVQEDLEVNEGAIEGDDGSDSSSSEESDSGSSEPKKGQQFVFKEFKGMNHFRRQLRSSDHEPAVKNTTGSSGTGGSSEDDVEINTKDGSNGASNEINGNGETLGVNEKARPKMRSQDVQIEDGHIFGFHHNKYSGNTDFEILVLDRNVTESHEHVKDQDDAGPLVKCPKGEDVNMESSSSSEESSGDHSEEPSSGSGDSEEGNGMVFQEFGGMDNFRSHIRANVEINTKDGSSGANNEITGNGVTLGVNEKARPKMRSQDVQIEDGNSFGFHHNKYSGNTDFEILVLDRNVKGSHEYVKDQDDAGPLVKCPKGEDVNMESSEESSGDNSEEPNSGSGDSEEGNRMVFQEFGGMDNFRSQLRDRQSNNKEHVATSQDSSDSSDTNTDNENTADQNLKDLVPNSIADSKSKVGVSSVMGMEEKKETSHKQHQINTSGERDADDETSSAESTGSSSTKLRKKRKKEKRNSKTDNETGVIPQESANKSLTEPPKQINTGTMKKDIGNSSDLLKRKAERTESRPENNNETNKSKKSEEALTKTDDGLGIVGEPQGNETLSTSKQKTKRDKPKRKKAKEKDSLVSANERRLQAVKGRQDEMKAKQKAIKEALSSVDSTQKPKDKNHMRFDSSSEDSASEGVHEGNDLKESTRVPDSANVSAQSMQIDSSDIDSDNEGVVKKKKEVISLFKDDDDEDSASDTERFKSKPQFEGEKGAELLKLQDTFGEDRRFHLDERFAEDDQSSDDDREDHQGDAEEGDINQAEGEGCEEDLETEKAKSLSILENVLGVMLPQKSHAEEMKTKFRDVNQIKFDPTREDHSKFVLAPSRSKPKKKKLSVKETTETPLPEVSKETFADFQPDLKAAFSQEQPVTFGFFSDEANEDPGSQKTDEVGEESTPPPAFDKQKLPWDSSDSEEEIEEVNETSQRFEDDPAPPPVATPQSRSFFFNSNSDDHRLKSGFGRFCRSKQDSDTDRWKETRTEMLIASTKRHQKALRDSQRMPNRRGRSAKRRRTGKKF